MEVIYGIHAVEEALKACGRAFEYVGVARDRKDSRVQRILESSRAAGVAVRFLPREQVERLAGNAAHQGVVAVASAKAYSDLDEVLSRRRGEHAFVVVLDGVEDPHNLGAILRTADAAGADGVVIPERRAVGVTATVAKASAGASEHLPIARVTNVSRALEELKARDLWTVGLDERAPSPTTSSTTGCTARWCWAPRARDCTRWCAHAATSWFPSPCWAGCRRSTSPWPPRW